MAQKTLFAFKGFKSGLSDEEYAKQKEREDREATEQIAAAKASKPVPVPKRGPGLRHAHAPQSSSKRVNPPSTQGVWMLNQL